MYENTEGSSSRGLISLEKHLYDEVYVVRPYKDSEYNHRWIIKDSRSLPFNDGDDNDFIIDTKYLDMTWIFDEQTPIYASSVLLVLTTLAPITWPL